MTLTEIARRIHDHLKAMEADPVFNAPYEARGAKGLRHYYNSGAGRAGRYVWVVYVNYQGHISLTRAEAERYLAWLDAGNRGSHWEALRATP